MRIELDLGVTILSASAGLANVFAFGFRMFADGLAVSHLRLANIGFDLVLAHHAIDDDLEVQLPHAADDRLSAVGIGVNFESGIFLGQLGQRHAHLFLIGFRLGLDCDGDNRNGKFDGFKRDRVLRIANRVASRNVLQADRSANIAR